MQDGIQSGEGLCCERRRSVQTVLCGVPSGLYRRDEGEMVIIAQSNGKEMSVPRKEIKERRTSETSLMPDNFGEAIPKEEFDDLIAFLLTKNVKPPGK